MDAITDQAFLQSVAEWRQAKDAKAQWEAREKELRAAIVAYAFPAEGRVEGVNRQELGGDAKGYKLKLTHKIERKIEEGSLQAVAEMVEILRKAHAGEPLTEIEQGALNQFGLEIPRPFSMDVLIRNKPELDTKNYKSLTDAQRAVFDVALIIKDGSPSLELEEPKPAAEAPPVK